MEGNLQLALKMFRFYRYQQQTLISKQTLTDILNRQAAHNIHTTFNQHIIEQIWGQAETTSKGEATALTFSKIYAQAMTILEDRIGSIDCPIGIQKNKKILTLQKQKLARLEGEYEKGYQQNYDPINTVRRNIAQLQNKIQELQQNRNDFQKELELMKACLKVDEKIQDPVLAVTQLITQLAKNIEIPNEDLGLIFKATVIGIAIQLLFLGLRFSFLGLLCYLLIVFWLFLGYYDHNFVKWMIGSLIISFIMDSIYIALTFKENIGSYRYYHMQTIWRFVNMAFIIVQLFLRVILSYKLSLFKEPTAKRQFFMLFDHKIQLNARSGKVFSQNNDRS